MSRLRLIITGHLAYQPPLIYLNQLNEQVLTYLQKWEQDAEDHQELSKAERAKCLLSCNLRFDISSMIIVFQEEGKMAFSRFPGSTISPLHTTSNLVENIFAKKRATMGKLQTQGMPSMAQL